MGFRAAIEFEKDMKDQMIALADSYKSEMLQAQEEARQNSTLARRSSQFAQRYADAVHMIGTKAQSELQDRDYSILELAGMVSEMKGLATHWESSAQQLYAEANKQMQGNVKCLQLTGNSMAKLKGEFDTAELYARQGSAASTALRTLRDQVPLAEVKFKQMEEKLQRNEAAHSTDSICFAMEIHYLRATLEEGQREVLRFSNSGTDAESQQLKLQLENISQRATRTQEEIQESKNCIQVLARERDEAGQHCEVLKAQALEYQKIVQDWEIEMQSCHHRVEFRISQHLSSLTS
jgi:hypothetical protein